MSDEDAIRALIGRATELGAHLQEATRPPRYTYIRVTWDHVNDRAAEGWQLTPLTPYYDIPGSSGLFFTMARQLSTAELLIAEAEQATGEGE